MLKNAASREKAEVQAKVEDKIKNIRSSLNLDLDLSLPSLAAALLNGLFEHPANVCLLPNRADHKVSLTPVVLLPHCRHNASE